MRAFLDIPALQVYCALPCSFPYLSLGITVHGGQSSTQARGLACVLSTDRKLLVVYLLILRLNLPSLDSINRQYPIPVAINTEAIDIKADHVSESPIPIEILNVIPSTNGGQRAITIKVSPASPASTPKMPLSLNI